MARLFEYLPRVGNNNDLTPSGRASRANRGFTRREGQIMELVAYGRSNKEIATELGLATGTVKVYVSRVMEKFGFESRYQVISWRLRNVQEIMLNDSPAVHAAGLGYREGAD